MPFKDTDKTVFVGRRDDGSIYGIWTVRQWEGQEEMLAEDPEVLAGPVPLSKEQIAAIRAGKEVDPAIALVSAENAAKG